MDQAAKPASNTGPIPIIYLTGSHYDIGHQVGETYRSEIHLALEQHSTLNSEVIPFYETPRGEQAYSQLLAASKQRLPQYVDEIRGIAAGAQAEFYKLFLLHIEADLSALMKQKESNTGEGCSDFLVNNEQWSLHVHSEDSDPGVRDLGVIWMADIEASETNGHKEESFIAFAYPGMIPGNAWTVNSHGLMTSGNIISQKQVFTPGMLPRRLVCRALMNEKSLDALIQTSKALPAMASAFNFMISQRLGEGKEPACVKMESVEIVGKGEENQIIQKPAGSFQYHFNEFQWMSEDFYPDPSSRVREKRLEELKEEFSGDPSTLTHIKLIMSDTKYKDYPYYRDGAPPDYLATANIAIADRYKDELNIYKLKPSENEPSVMFDIKPWADTGVLAQSRLIK